MTMAEDERRKDRRKDSWSDLIARTSASPAGETREVSRSVEPISAWPKVGKRAWARRVACATFAVAVSFCFALLLASPDDSPKPDRSAVRQRYPARRARTAPTFKRGKVESPTGTPHLQGHDSRQSRRYRFAVEPPHGADAVGASRSHISESAEPSLEIQLPANETGPAPHQVAPTRGGGLADGATESPEFGL